MKKLSYFLVYITLLAGCAGNPKEAKKPATVSINKIWVFKKIDTAKSDIKGSGSLWIGGNTIDMSKPDTLHYSTIATHNGATTYPYKVSGNEIYLNGRQTYKIIKLTDSILELSALYRVKEQSGEEHELNVVMIYAAR